MLPLVLQKLVALIRTSANARAFWEDIFGLVTAAFISINCSRLAAIIRVSCPRRSANYSITLCSRVDMHVEDLIFIIVPSISGHDPICWMQAQGPTLKRSEHLAA